MFGLWDVDIVFGPLTFSEFWN